MLWELLANRRMWQDTKDIEVMKIVISQQMPSPREHAPGIPLELEAICMKAIRRDPAERYESCAAMQADLERAMVVLGLRPSERELAKLLQDQFAEVRTRIRSAIDRRLKEGDTGPINLRVDERGLLISDLFTPRSRRGDMSGTPSAVGVPEQVPAKKSRWWLGLLALLLLGGIAFAVVARPQYFREIGRPLVTVSAVQKPLESARPAAAPVTATVHVDLRSSPAAAKLFLDGLELPSNPFVRDLPSDTARHELSAEAAGYEKKSKLLFLSGSEPVDAEIVLEKTSKPKLAAKPVVARPSRKAPGSAPAAPDCSYPFYVDEAGIRRVRHECM
jgi:serine/threonine-protein kinase